MIRKIEFDVVSSRLTIWWEDSDKPFVASEYQLGSRTMEHLSKLERKIRTAVIEAAWNLA